MIASLALAQSCTHTHTHTLDATLLYLPLHLHRDGMLNYDIFFCTRTNLHTHMMLRYDFFSCACTRAWCYVMMPFPALAQSCAHTHDATWWFLLLRLRAHTHTHLMLRYDIFSCTCTRTGCYVMVSSLALAQSCMRTWCDVIMSSRGQNLPTDFEAQFGKLTTDWQTWKKMEHVQIRLLVVTWSKQIIHKIATLEAACDWSQRLKILGKS